ncbi:SCO family protein (plasmid) [Paracoccus sp. TK19116]|uniref:SCO family protein n=1 Tax=Paracoccus albicereus TaxID=2922394 RepID=A0ABT1MM65_9RHOB|nr:SCO family protein [Paracoccus albicereus]MCQ0969189.1 SCO family protein [Paracoccus albicereus]
MAQTRTLILTSTLAAAVLLVGGWLVIRPSGTDGFQQCMRSNVQGGMDSFGTSFTLTNQDGERVTDAEVFSQPSLLYFGYTFCPDVCPMDTARNAAAVDILQERGLNAQSVFVTVDPACDTPEALSEFADAVAPDMIGLTGSQAEIDAVSKGWRNYYKLLNEDDADYYLVDHLANSYLILPKQGTVEFFPRDVSADEMAERSACFIDAAAS